MKSTLSHTPNTSPGSLSTSSATRAIVIEEGLLITDLWAWGPEAPAALISVAVTLIIGGAVIDDRLFRFEPRPQLRAGATLDRATCDWWADRRREGHYLIKRCFGGDKCGVADMGKALCELYSHLPIGAPVWFANASVEAPLLRSAILRAEIVPPWSTQEQLCLNTLRRVS
jgi:hypothetical protein